MFSYHHVPSFAEVGYLYTIAYLLYVRYKEKMALDFKSYQLELFGLFAIRTKVILTDLIWVYCA